MRKTRIVFGEYLPDAPEVETSVAGLNECSNVVPTAFGYRSIDGWAAVGGTGAVADGTTIIGALSTKNGAATVDFVSDTANIFYIDSDGISTVTGAAGTVQTQGDVAFRDFVQYGTRVIAVSGDKDTATTVGEPSYFDLGVSSSFTQLTSSFTARTVAVLKDFVVVGNTWDSADTYKPTRVRWSAFGNSADWVPSASTQSDIQDLQDDLGEIQRIVGGPNAFVVGQRGTYLMSYVGPPIIMQFDYIHPGIGTDHPQSVVRVGGYCYFLSQSGFVRVGQSPGDVKYIGAGKVDITIQELSSSGVAAGTRVRGYHDPRNQGVGFQYDDDTGKSLFYSYAFDRWARHGGVGTERSNCSLVYFSDLSKWASGSQSRVATAHGISTNDILYSNSDARAEKTVIGTGFIQLGSKRSLISHIRPLVDSSSGQGLKNPILRVKTISDLDQVAINSGTGMNIATWQDEGFFSGLGSAFVEGKYHRFRLENSDTESDRAQAMEWLGMDVYYEETGEY